MTKIARFVQFPSDWISLLGKIEEDGIPESIPTFVIASLVPSEADGGKAISVFEIGSEDLAEKLAAAFKFKVPVERCVMIVADKAEFSSAGLSLNTSKGDTGFPEIDELHRDLDVSTSDSIMIAAKIFMRGSIISVEKRKIEEKMEYCARNNEIDFRLISSRPKVPFKDRTIDYVKRSVINIVGVI